MLYVTTRNNVQTFDAHYSLVQNVSDDGSPFVPQQFPVYSKSDLLKLKEKSFGQTIADLLNLFFDTELTSWDVDFCIGRSTTRIFLLNNKLINIELWHNPGDGFQYLETRLYKTVCKNLSEEVPSEWFQICVRISALFATFGELFRQNIVNNCTNLDLSVSGNDLTMPLAALYAKRMGLPIGTLIITSDQNKVLWDLIHRGEIFVARKSAHLVSGIERLVNNALGISGAQSFFEAYNQGRVFHLDEEALPVLNSEIFCVISGSDRAKQTINSVYRTNNYLLDPCSAMCAGGLQDFRARTGEHKQTLIFSEQSPRLSLNEIESATGLHKRKITDLISML